jgi:hypothetical protein
MNELILLILLNNLIIIKKKNIKSFNDNLNYSKLLNKLFNNKNIFLKKKKMNFLLYSKKTKIENAIMITKIIPFIKHNLLINTKKSKTSISTFLKNLCNNKKIINNIIKIHKEDFEYFIKNFENLFNYEWEFIPEIDEINSIRHIISNYYNEIYLKIFDKYLNYNLNNYIQINKYNFSIEEITKLMSK